MSKVPVLYVHALLIPILYGIAKNNVESIQHNAGRWLLLGFSPCRGVQLGRLRVRVCSRSGCGCCQIMQGSGSRSPRVCLFSFIRYAVNKTIQTAPREDHHGSRGAAHLFAVLLSAWGSLLLSAREQITPRELCSSFTLSPFQSVQGVSSCDSVPPDLLQCVR